MTLLRRIFNGEPPVREGLTHLLVDSVHGGASVGFLAPLQYETASDYWDGVFSALGPGLALWIAEQEGQVVGSVQLALCQKENGLHRAEVQKLFVHSAFRGRGIASQLMTAAEGFARSEGRSLLVLDTQAGSHAEAVYQHLGWSRLGEIPNYAKSPDGTLHATAYYFKAL
jgi:acetyltransferase